jgi:predicted nuclease of predicted toxin-antitoxin system
MSLLLDANISWRSAAVLKNHYGSCFHVDRISLSVPAKDMEIWEYARQHNLIIVSNDEDFINLLMVKGFPPKVVLLKTGNQSRAAVEELLISIKPQIMDLQVSLEVGLLEVVNS